MKCQNCGKNEVNFHYSSNVNGSVTEMHLCAECAMQSGYDLESMVDLGTFFNEMLPMQTMRSPFSGNGRVSGFMPMAIPVVSPDSMMPFKVNPNMYPAHPSGAHPNGQHPSGPNMNRPHPGYRYSGTNTRKNVEVDENMSKLRELNVELRVAVEREEYEKAAELRDKIKELKALVRGETNEVR